jgi:hypothetical protein
MEEGLIDLDPLDTQLSDELQTVKWFIDLSGRICIETKEDAKKRGVSSPNRADAAAMCTVEASTILRMNTETIAGTLLAKAM